ncbi:MAG: DegV family protein [Coriobacteriia bacterium]|nr:DegV family protein [Coriobacteriia bacterium]MBN2841138.1 DegV family protein [Coriobacteriia bacterium]
MSERQGICIVTDSTSDIPRDLADEMGITIVPLSVTIEGETFSDGTISLEEFFRRMNAAKELPKTSQPSVGAFLETFKERLEHCSEVVCVTISHRLSGTFESAAEAARELGGRVHVLDTLNLSWGEGYQVVEVARAAAEGATVDQIKERFAELRSRVHMIVGLDSVENLAKGGRIGKVAAIVGGLLKMRVTLTVAEDGSFEPVGRARGAIAGMQSSVDWVATKIDEHLPADFAVQHALSPDKAQWLEETIRARFNVRELRVIEAGAVISTHTGTGWGITAVQV